MTFVPPASLGPFTFPAPWNSQAIRLTNASNAPQGCEPRLYSYWSVCNNHRGRPDLYVFVQRKGLIPIVLSVNKATGQVSLLRELPWAGLSSGEGSYFSDTDSTKLYWLAANELRTTNVETGQTETVFTLDAQYGDDLWQAHSSADDSVHSATVRRRTSDGPYEVRGAVVASNGQQRFVPKQGNFDECQIDKSGRWLVLQENDDNRILDLRTGTTRVLRNGDGAVAHSDVGDGILIGEDDQHEPGALVKWDLENPNSSRELIWRAPDWGPGLGHVAVRAGRALLSSNWSNELLDVSLADGTYRVIAPGMVDGSDYDHQLRASFDPAGEYACWIAFVDGRFDAFLVRVSSMSQPPIVIPPTKPPTGGSIVPGSQSYPDENVWWTNFLDEMDNLYQQAGQRWDLGAFKWATRTAFDIGAGLEKEQSKAKHLRELKTALGLTDPF